MIPDFEEYMSFYGELLDNFPTEIHSGLYPGFDSEGMANRFRERLNSMVNKSNGTCTDNRTRDVGIVETAEITELLENETNLTARAQLRLQYLYEYWNRGGNRIDPLLYSYTICIFIEMGFFHPEIKFEIGSEYHILNEDFMRGLHNEGFELARDFFTSTLGLVEKFANSVILIVICGVILVIMIIFSILYLIFYKIL